MMTSRWVIRLYFGMAVLPGMVLAQTPPAPLALDLQPNSIAVSASYAAVQTRAILHNALATPITLLDLSVQTNDGLQIDPGKPSLYTAQPGQDIVWIIKIKDPTHARLPAAAVFQARYKRMDQPGVFLAFGSLAVTSQPDSKPIEVSIQGAFDSVSQQRPADGALLITNNLDLPVNFEVRFWPSAPMTIDPIQPFQVQPRSTSRIPIRISTMGAITPGVYPAEFEIIAKWNWAGQTEERDLIVNQQVTLGVFFESDLLKLLGIPSFLLLPGALILFTMQLLLAFNVFGAKNESKLPDLGVTTPGFWILAITLSAMFAPIYIWRSGHNYLIRYGMEDLIYVWIWSILAGLVLYLFIAGIARAIRHKRIPTAQDDQITTLERMARNKLGVVVPEVRFTINNVAWKGFQIEPLEDGMTMLWVAPQIRAEWGEEHEALEAMAEVNALLNAAQTPISRINGQRVDKHEITRRIAVKLKDAKKKDQVNLKWEPRAVVQGQPSNIACPQHIKIDSVTEYREAGRILR